MGFRRVGLLGSHVANCHVCGHPYPPDRLYRFDGKLVCIFHRRDHTRAQLDANWTIAQRLVQRSVTISGMQPIDSDGVPVPPPVPGVPPPDDTGGGGEGGGGGTGGDGGDGGTGGSGDGGGTLPPGTITAEDYIDASCGMPDTTPPTPDPIDTGDPSGSGSDPSSGGTSPDSSGCGGE